MKQKRRCVIVGAAEITEYDRIKSCLREDDFFVYCDAGLKHLEKLSGILTLSKSRKPI